MASQATTSSGTMNGENGAVSYADAASPVPRTVKPVFIKEMDIFGTREVPKEMWLNHVELYRAIADAVPIEQLTGLQRVRGMWRIYLDSQESRDRLVTAGIVVRHKSIKIYASNPNIPYYVGNEDTTLVRVKNVPLSAFDGQIKRDLELKGCEILSMYRERLRVDGFLTNCETGDRIVTVRKLSSPLPSIITIGGKYRAVIRHRGQPNENAKCGNCLQSGHLSRDCPNEKVCRECKNPGHIKSQCPILWQQDSGSDDSSDSSSSSSDDDSHDETLSQPTAEIRKEPIQKAHTPEESDSHPQRQQQARRRKQKKGKSGKKKSDGQNDAATATARDTSQRLLDSYLKDTPSRKSSQLSADIRSPLEDINNSPKKKK